MQLANIIKICHKIHKLKLIVSVSQHLSIQPPSIQPPSIQHPSIQRPSIQCPSIQCPSIQGPPSNTLLLAPSVKRSTSSVLPPSAFTLHPAPTFSSRLPPGAFSLSKCSHRPIFRDRRRVFPAKVLPPSRILGQKAHFRDRRRSSGIEGAVGVSICATSGAVGVFRDSNTTFFPMGL